jgi:hypothetical protein
VPPLAGKVDGFAVAATAHRTGDGAVVVLEDVDPHAADSIATHDRSVKGKAGE